jgi:hypothetical protein
MRERLSFGDQTQTSHSIPTVETKSRFAAESTGYGEPVAQRRPRSGTWSGESDLTNTHDTISKKKYDFTVRKLQAIEETPSPANKGSLKRTLSSPGLMTHNEPPKEGWKHKESAGARRMECRRPQ